MSKKKKIIVIIGAGLLQIPLIKEAKKQNLFTIVVDKNQNALGGKFSDVFLPISTADYANIIIALTSYKKRIKYCTTAGTDFTRTVAEINEAFSLRGAKHNLNIKQSIVSSEKSKMRDFLKSILVKQPDYIYSNRKDVLLKWAKEKEFKHGFVIKPVQNMGARGVMFFQHPEELVFSFEYAAYYSKDKLLILEEYIPAHELSTDALVYKGKVYLTGMADRIIELKDKRFFIETGHTMPSVYYDKLQEQITVVLQKITDGLSQLSSKPFNGAIKGDIRITKNNEIYIGEFATRLSGGFMSTHTYPNSSGNNLIYTKQKTKMAF